MTRPSSRQLIGLGALLTAAGLTIAGTAPISGTAAADANRVQSLAGGAAVVVGWLVLAWGIHRFGRQG